MFLIKKLREEGGGASFDGIDYCRAWRRVRISELSLELRLKRDGQGSGNNRIT